MITPQSNPTTNCLDSVQKSIETQAPRNYRNKIFQNQVSYISSHTWRKEQYHCIVFECLYSAPQQPWEHRGAFNKLALRQP